MEARGDHSNIIRPGWPERYRNHDKDCAEEAREALDSLKKMARAWKAKLEAETVEGELSEEGG